MRGPIVLLAAILFSPASWGAIATDSVGAMQDATSVTGFTYPHTVGSGSDRFISVIGGGSNVTEEAITGTYAGEALTFLSYARTNNSAQRVYLLYMVAPPSGTANVVIDFAVTLNTAHSHTTSWTGVDQASPYGTPANDQGAAGTVTTVAPNTDAGDTAYSMTIFGVASGTLTPGNGQTLLATTGADSRPIGDAYKAADTPTTTLSWTCTASGNFGSLGVAMNAAPEPPPTPSSGCITSAWSTGAGWSISSDGCSGWATDSLSSEPF